MVLDRSDSWSGHVRQAVLGPVFWVAAVVRQGSWPTVAATLSSYVFISILISSPSPIATTAGPVVIGPLAGEGSGPLESGFPGIAGVVCVPGTGTGLANGPSKLLLVEIWPLVIFLKRKR